jgi:DNA-binding response OmpR family regulator
MKQKHKVLIVEDEISLAKVLRDNFIKDGFDVLLAEDGKIGLDMALREMPEIILLDIAMPVMDGLEMLKLLKDDRVGKEIPVVILTNYGDMEKFKQAKELGVADYLVKADWSMRDITILVRQIIANRDSSSA